MKRTLPFAGMVLMPLAVGVATPARSAHPPVVSQLVLRKAGPHGDWQFVYRYPRLATEAASPGSRSAIERFNGQMKTQAVQALTAFQKELIEYGAKPAPGGVKSELDVHYQIVTRTPALIAVKFTQSVYYAGAAHPFATVFTSNFALPGGFLKLSDLFAANSEFLRTIAAAVERDLTAQAQAKHFEIIEPKGYAPQAENFQRFTITSGGLQISFDQASVAPSYVGTLAATVPWSALEGVLSQEGRRLREEAARR
jgi:hypothetical protein